MFGIFKTSQPRASRSRLMAAVIETVEERRLLSGAVPGAAGSLLVQDLASAAVAVPLSHGSDDASGDDRGGRGGHGADDPAGHDADDDHGGHGADDPAGHDANDDHGGATGGTDDPAGHDANDDHGGATGGTDDPANHDAGDDHGSGGHGADDGAAGI